MSNQTPRQQRNDAVWPVGPRGLMIGLLHRAHEDYRLMENHGLVKDGKRSRDWPIVRYPGRNPEPETISGIRDPGFRDEVLDFWNSDLPQIACDIIGPNLTAEEARRQLGLRTDWRAVK